ncbi:exodeoxyribonuclease V subunit beta [Luteimonas sp. BDR2-5]|uniref:exodeoxyribonuclease V subunit beta n=1 Tax=Proluteimonas luteida TaxID=2878685 RepID=UPI001E4FB776|nr:exodeoxyribonuclease V subunit beta [Luteimonas sp. BDR2-5]MCD9029026.1 exodeoxyribonuclease V subunit beta [Luteimonas sp. BDR2-5]
MSATVDPAIDPVADPYLTLPLDGVRLIEASAGTGKTFTLATLFTRLVVERGLRIGQILAVTFTDAATQELRRRIRERLDLAARLVGSAASADDSAEAVLTHRVLERHLASGSETPAQLARRLRSAAEEIDLAAIFTIHGFCSRVLAEHALDSGQSFDAPELLANLRELHEELAADLWRMQGSDDASLDALTGLWRTPDALAADLHALAGDLPLLPPPAADTGADPRPARDAAATRLLQAIDADIAEAQAQVASAFERKVFDGRRAKRPSFDKAFDELLAGRAAAHWPRTAKTHLQKLLPEHLPGFCKDGQQDRAPCSPLFDALQVWCAADDAVDAWRAQQRIALLHRLRGIARTRLAARKRQRRVQTYDDLIAGVADALDGPHRQSLVAQLRAQYRIALVDEFQDTDARQWTIFQRVFGNAADAGEVGQVPETPALFLIGDPKQAIYGFRGGDVHTYLQARARAEVAPPLDRNFRSRPGVLRAIEALYANAGDDAFVEHGIRFAPVHPGTRRRDADYLQRGAPAPALTLRLLRSEDGRPLSADASRAAATAACVADIHRVLSDARAGEATIGGRPVQPGDIAVLVRTHREATRIQQALSAAGIPAVAAGRQSLYATTEAHELRLLLLALLQPADEGRLRAALATVLLGGDAAAIAALDGDGVRQRFWQDRLLHWRERWQRGGPFALVSDLCAGEAERLLALLDGERRLTNYLQLGELLQEAAARTLGLHGLLDWLQLQIAHADAGDEAQLLRLESDARRVQVVTLHKSKGLEYPLVHLPFVGIGTHPPTTAHHHAVHDGTRRALHWKIQGDAAWQDAGQRAAAEREAEDARLLYVGLTRAEHALWIAAGDLRDFAATRLRPLLSDLDALRAHADIRIVDGPVEPAPPRLAPEREAAVAPVRRLQRQIASDWWVYSFTQLASADGGHEIAAAATEADGGADDEPAAPAPDTIDTDGDAREADAFDPRFAGSRFGNVLHGAMEHAGFAAWAGWREGDPAPAGEDATLREALRNEGYAQGDLDDGVALLTSLVGRTLTTALPEGGALHALPAHDRRAEIEFHFAMQPTAVPALLDLLHAHGIVRDRRGFGLRRRLEGLMTGKIDLTYVQAGRWYVLDYKSNRLPRYDAAALAEAMAHSEYDLQSLIYTVALHRWLRFRLGDGYDYDRDFGGIRYLFCRGLDPARTPSPGLYAHRFAPELVHAVDALFSGNTPSADEPLSRERERGWGEGSAPARGAQP